MQLCESHPTLEQLERVLQQRGLWHAVCQEPTCPQRFLSAAQHDVDKACAMLVDMLRWRQENGVDLLLTNFQFPERQALMSAYPQGYHKVDRLGRPVYIQQLGRADIDALLSVTSEERMLMWHIYEYERLLRVLLPACSVAAGRPVTQSFSILDLKGIKFRDFMKVKSVMTSFCKLDNAYYPETSGHMAIINAPSWFGGVFSFFKSFMSPQAQKRVEVLGANWKQQLLQHIAPENLHCEYGGTSHGCITDDIGPWQHICAAPAPATAVLVRVSSTSSNESEQAAAGELGLENLHHPASHAHQRRGSGQGRHPQPHPAGSTTPVPQQPRQTWHAQPHLHIHVPRAESVSSNSSALSVPFLSADAGAEDGNLTPMSAAAVSLRSLSMVSATGYHTPHSSFTGSLASPGHSNLGDVEMFHRGGRSSIIGRGFRRVGQLGSSLVGRGARRRHAARHAEELSEDGPDCWSPLPASDSVPLQHLYSGKLPPHSSGVDGPGLVARAKSGISASFSYLAGQRMSSGGGGVGGADAGQGGSGVHGLRPRTGLLTQEDSGGMDEDDGSYKAAPSGCCGLRFGRSRP